MGDPVTQTNDQTTPTAFKVDLSGIKAQAPQAQPVYISGSPESGPIIIDNKVEQKVDTPNIEKPVEYGNQLIEKIESQEKLRAEKNDAVKENSDATPAVNTTPLVAQQEVKPLVVEEPKVKNSDVIKYSGYPIEEQVINNTEEIKNNKGKGDPGIGATAIWIFLDRLLRSRAKSK